MSTFHKLVPYFSEEEGKFVTSTKDLLHQYGDPVSALLYSTVFLPNFVEVDGSVLLENNIDDEATRFAKARQDTNLSLAALEASFNSIEVAYLFYRNEIRSDAIEARLASIIADAWRARLKYLYCDRVFSVSVVGPEDSGSVYSVQFFEIR